MHILVVERNIYIDKTELVIVHSSEYAVHAKARWLMELSDFISVHQLMSADVGFSQQLGMERIFVCITHLARKKD